MQRIGLLLALACAAWLLPAAAHAQEPWRPAVTSCANGDGSAGCAAARNLAGAWNTTVTPDGRTAYVAAFNAAAIGVFDRDPQTGALTQKPGGAGCINEGGSSGCAEGRGFASPDGMSIAPDGRRVHVSGWSGGGGAAVLTRDPATGVLSQRLEKDACIGNAASSECLDGHGLSSAAGSLQASADGRHLYVGVNPVAVVRSSQSGVLSQDPGADGCVSTPAQDGCTGVAGLSAGRQPVLAPDGRQLYVPTTTGIVVLDRDDATGALSQRAGGTGCLNATQLTGCTTEPRVGGALGLTMSGDGRHVYAATSGGMVTLARAADGSVAVQSCVREPAPAIAGCTAGSGIQGLSYAAISPDGHDLVASRLGGAGGVAIFSRDPATGDLAQRPGVDGCITPDGRSFGGVAGGCRAHPTIGSDGHVTFSSDLHFYAAAFSTSAVATVKRDFAPTCADTTASIPHNLSASIALPCSDRNGDALALSVVAAPRSGALGAIDQAGSNVRYDPFGGFTGADEFTFKAEAAGQESAPARAALAIEPPAPAAAPPAPALRRIRSAVSSRWGVRGKRIFALALAVKAPPRGARATLACKGEDCPFRTRKITRIRNDKLTVFTPLAPGRAATTKIRSFRAGQRLELRITAAGQIGKAVRFKLERGKIPTGRQGCLTPGQTRFRTRC